MRSKPADVKQGLRKIAGIKSRLKNKHLRQSRKTKAEWKKKTTMSSIRQKGNFIHEYYPGQILKGAVQLSRRTSHICNIIDLTSYSWSYPQPGGSAFTWYPNHMLVLYYVIWCFPDEIVRLSCRNCVHRPCYLYLSCKLSHERYRSREANLAQCKTTAQSWACAHSFSCMPTTTTFNNTIISRNPAVHKISFSGVNSHISGCFHSVP